MIIRVDLLGAEIAFLDFLKPHSARILGGKCDICNIKKANIE